MTFHDQQYINLVQTVLETGVRKPNRTGVDTIGVFGYQMRFTLRDGTIPLLTTKKMFTRAIIHEILWYLQGSDNIKYLTDNDVHIWDSWADKNGNLNKVYGYQWRNWDNYTLVPAHAEENEWVPSEYKVSHIDQIAQLMDKLKNNPNDRRMIVSSWNVADIPTMALPPCHYSFQCYARPLNIEERLALAGWNSNNTFFTAQIEDATVYLDNKNIPKYELSMILSQRSCDIGLGVPFNIVQYSILLRMFAKVANMVPGEFVWNGGDVHVYVNHVNQLKEQCQRSLLPSPTLYIPKVVNSIDDFKFDDFKIAGYESHPSIKMEVAV